MKLKSWFSWLKRRGYHELPSTWQSPTPPEPVDKTDWQVCANCDRLIPARKDYVPGPGTTLLPAGTWTYVCPFCEHCHAGTPQDWNEDIKAQKQCHHCEAELGAAYQCPECHYPRGWTRVTCPYCGNRQPVCMPHWVVRCDVFHLQCVQCESEYHSLCIC